MKEVRKLKASIGRLKSAFLRVSAPFGFLLLLVSCGQAGGDETILLNVLESTVRENENLKKTIEDLKEENMRFREQYNRDLNNPPNGWRNKPETGLDSGRENQSLR